MNEQYITDIFETAKNNAIKLLKENIDNIDYSTYPDIYIDFQAEGLENETTIYITTKFTKTDTGYKAEEPEIH